MQLSKLCKQQSTTTRATIHVCLDWKPFLPTFLKWRWHKQWRPLKRQHKGGRGLLLVWRREFEKKLWINWHLPGQSRGATLAIMAQMDQWPGRRLGVHWEILCDCNHGDMESTRTQYCQTSPQTEEAPQILPITWPRCLGRGAPACNFQPPSPTPSSTSSDSSEPPSLKSLMEPESRHEVSVSSALSSDTD